MAHVTRPSDIFPPHLLAEYRRLAAINGPVITYQSCDQEDGFYAELKVKSWCQRLMKTGSDAMGLAASVAWLREGPKLVHVSEDQYQAMANVDVRLELHDFMAPYPTMLVSMPPGHLHRCCLAHRFSEDVLVLFQISEDNKSDICTIVRQRPGTFMEDSLERYDSSLADVASESCCTLRVACNMLLAMASYDCRSRFLFPEEVRRDQKYASKGDRPGREGRTASDRLREAPVLVELDRSISLVRYGSAHEAGESTGREMPFHWRRGTWVMQPFGPGSGQRKRIFRRPTMVRADRLTVSPADTTTTYK